MENNIKILQKSELFGKEITVYGSVDNPLFLAKDVAEWLELTNVTDMVSRIEKDEVTKFNLGGLQGVCNFLTEDGLYEAFMQSRKPIAKQFKKGVKEILKSIRKTGGYLVTSENDTPEIIMAKAILVAQETIKKKDEKLKQLEHRNSILEPKAELMDKVMDTDQKIDIGQAAKILQLPFGRNTLFQKLREKGIFFANRNEPKQEYVKRGYFELKEKWIDRDNHDGFMVVKVLVTQRGLDFIAKLFEIVKQSKKMMSLN